MDGSEPRAAERYGAWDGDGGRTKTDEEAQLLPTEEFELDDAGNDPETDVDATHSSRRFRISRPVPSTHRRSGIVGWLSGPQPPRIQTIKPLLPKLQQSLLDWLDRALPAAIPRAVLLVIFFLAWVAAFSMPLYLGTRTITDQDGRKVLDLDCTNALWARKNECGLDGIDCKPFANSSFSFRCPANCAGVMVLNPRAVGPLDVTYSSLVVGDGPYRGDSFICGSAIHAGIVTDSGGGCGRIDRVGKHDGFESTTRNGIESIPFDSYFPLSFTLSPDTSLECDSADPRRIILFISLGFTAVFSLFATSPAWQFFAIFAATFAHVSLVSDPPGPSFPDADLVPDRVSTMVGRLLPSAFCAVILYWTCVRRTLSGLKAQFEKTWLWLGGFWFGALSNYTFGWLPIQRLTAHDIEQQPGAKLALVFIVLVLLLVVAQQIYFFRLEGRLPRYLALYGVFLGGIAFSMALPGLQLRLHHYIIALLLLPGTSMQTRPSLLYQGILLGLFVNGVARWGFDSVLQTPDSLRSDGAFGSPLPLPAAPIISGGAESPSLSFIWESAKPLGLDGISALVNDVERFRAFFADSTSSGLAFDWNRSADLSVPEYFRFAYIKSGVTLDYTKPGTWFSNRTWSMES